MLLHVRMPPVLEIRWQTCKACSCTHASQHELSEAGKTMRDLQAQANTTRAEVETARSAWQCKVGGGANHSGRGCKSFWAGAQIILGGPSNLLRDTLATCSVLSWGRSDRVCSGHLDLSCLLSWGCSDCHTNIPCIHMECLANLTVYVHTHLTNGHLHCVTASQL